MRLVLFTLSIGVLFVSVGLAAISAASSSWILFESPQVSPIKIRTSYGLFQKCEQSILDRSSWICRKFPKQDADCRGPPQMDYLLPQLAAIDSTQDEVAASRGFLWEVVEKAKSHSQVVGQQPTIQREHRRRRRETSFCALWRLAGYTSQLSIVFGLGSIICMLAVLGGGRKSRAKAWPICAGLVGLHAAFQIATMAIVVQTYRTDQRFYAGTTLGYAFSLSLTSWILDVLLAFVMAVTGLYGQWEIPPKEGETEPLLASSSRS